MNGSQDRIEVMGLVGFCLEPAWHAHLSRMAPDPLLSNLGVVVEQAGLHEAVKGGLHARFNLRPAEEAGLSELEEWWGFRCSVGNS